MIVTKAATSDLAPIARIHRHARQQSMPWLPDLHTADEDYWFFETIVFVNETVFIANINKKAVGFISYKGDWLNHLYIDPQHWCQGVGTGLLETVKASSNRLQLRTFQQNQTARNFYKTRGFVEREFTNGQDCEEKLPDVRMEWCKTL